MLDELRETGIRIALDDFGTGFSSSSCLCQVPIDIVEIDRSFVADIEQAPGRGRTGARSLLPERNVPAP